MNLTLQEAQEELYIVNQKLDKINGRTDYTDLVAKSFPLGMVGGSGRNVASLNRKREASLEKTISNAVIATTLYKRQSELETHIKDIENNGPAKRAAKKEETNKLLAQYWLSLKAGDFIDIGNGKTLISKKNKKSLETGSGCKWTVSEIIGREAAKLIL